MGSTNDDEWVLQVRLWDPKTGKPFGDALKGHSKWVTSLSWEPIHLYATPLVLRFHICANVAVLIRNPTTPRLASSSKDGTVRVWSTSTRRCEYTLGGHTASVNVVKWGGGGSKGRGVLYTASSDRSVRVWDANGVRGLCRFILGVSFADLSQIREDSSTRSKTMRIGLPRWH
jgi:ribosome assembly protein 4